MNDTLINGGSGVCPTCGQYIYNNLLVHTQVCQQKQEPSCTCVLREARDFLWSDSLKSVWVVEGYDGEDTYVISLHETEAGAKEVKLRREKDPESFYEKCRVYERSLDK